MKRSVHLLSLVALVVVTILAASLLWWLWQASLSNPGAIRCGNDRHSVFACTANAGNYATAVLLFCGPLIGWLAHKAFFSRFKRDR